MLDQVDLVSDFGLLVSGSGDFEILIHLMIGLCKRSGR